MAGPDLSTLSSNWKILQQRLQATSKQENGVKRKREPEKSRAPSNGFKKTRLAVKTPSNRRKMGSYLSTSNPPPPATTLADKKNTLINDHDIDPSAIATAYGSTTTSSRTHKDDINGGLHPTRKVGKYISLDCEMVGSGPPPHADNVLARASLVNFHGEQIYDSYVQTPSSQIKVEDYRTHVSGIKPHHMRPGYARPFSQVQTDVAKLLNGRILVGHALKNDLQALMLSHPKRDLRDTSRYARFRIESKGKPPALRKLARSELGMEIQSGEHSSVEDARAAMMLFKKEKNGFEEENRKTFGTSRRVVGKGIEREVTPSIDGEEDEDEDEDEEEDEQIEDEDEVSRRSAQPRKKKTKKKKRTKRK